MDKKSFLVAYTTTGILTLIVEAMLGIVLVATIINALNNAGLGAYQAQASVFAFIGSAIFATDKFLEWSYDHPHMCVGCVACAETVASCLLLCGADMWLFITAGASSALFHIAWNNARIKMRNLVFKGDSATFLSTKLQPVWYLAASAGSLLGALIPTDNVSVGMLGIAATLAGVLDAIVQLRYLKYFLAKGIVFDSTED